MFSLLLDPFSLDFNDKKIASKIYAELLEQAVDLFEEKEQVNTQIINMLDRIINRSQYDTLEYNLELDWAQILKLYNVRVDLETTDIFHKILEYEKILVNVLHHRVLCMVNVRTYLNDDSIREIYKMAHYLKLQLIMIEAHEQDKIEDEQITIIDKDRCIIVK